MAPQLHRFDTAAELDRALADSVAACLREGVALRGQASLAVSGGRTPVGFFRLLGALPLPWASIWITLVDERWLAPDHADSNERLLRENLLDGPARAARFVPLKNGAATPEAGLDAATAALATIPRPFDAVVLGMGEDGHTASLFPGTRELATGLKPHHGETLIAVHPLHAPYARMSLTAPAILNSRCLFIHATGEKKLAVLALAQQADLPLQYPVSVALHQDTAPCHLYWTA